MGHGSKLLFNDRFQGQTQLHKSKPSDFRMAIEEAFLAEHGFLGTCLDEGNTACQPAYHQSVPRGIQEATDSNQEQECQSQIQARNYFRFIFHTFYLL